MHHAFGVASGARGEKHRRHIVRAGFGNFGFEKSGLLRGKRCALGQQGIKCQQTRLGIVAQATRLVINDVRQKRALRPDFQQLVHLLLVFYQRKAHIGIGDGKYAFATYCILVKRNRHSTQRLHCQHRSIKAWTVRTDHHHVLAALQTQLVEAASDFFYQHGHRTPAVRLPDAIFLFAHGSVQWTLAGMLEQQLRKRGVHTERKPQSNKKKRSQRMF